MDTISSTTTTPANNEHFIQLDGIRGIALLLVLLEHFLPDNHPIKQLGIGLGEIGVQCFFVLSGFLISGILLRYRDSRHRLETTPNLKHTLYAFYIRRALRIFPLYFLTLGLCAFFDLGRVRETWIWHITYLSNFGMVFSQEGFFHSAHFWTLSVEEQFYLFWPFVLLFIPERFLGRFLILLFVLAPCYRFAISLTNLPWLARSILTPACMDSLAAGSMLAFFRTKPELKEPLTRFLNRGLCVAIILKLFLALNIFPVRYDSAAEVVFSRTLSSVIFSWVIASAADGFRGLIGSLFESKTMRTLGIISYGVYVTHHFLIDIERNLIQNYDFYSFFGGWEIRFLILLLSSLALGFASWHLIEKPINNMKRLFPYDQS